MVRCAAGAGTADRCGRNRRSTGHAGAPRCARGGTGRPYGDTGLQRRTHAPHARPHGCAAAHRPFVELGRGARAHRRGLRCCAAGHLDLRNDERGRHQRARRNAYRARQDRPETPSHPAGYHEPHERGQYRGHAPTRHRRPCAGSGRRLVRARAAVRTPERAHPRIRPVGAAALLRIDGQRGGGCRKPAHARRRVPSPRYHHAAEHVMDASTALCTDARCGRIADPCPRHSLPAFGAGRPPGARGHRCRCAREPAGDGGRHEVDPRRYLGRARRGARAWLCGCALADRP